MEWQYLAVDPMEEIEANSKDLDTREYNSCVEQYGLAECEYMKPVESSPDMGDYTAIFIGIVLFYLMYKVSDLSQKLKDKAK